MTIIKDEVYKRDSYMFDLPPGLIAQHPATPRDRSRMLVVNRAARGGLQDRYFFELGSFLNPGDALVINETRVIQARILGTKDSGAKVEVFLLRKKGEFWEALVKPARRLKPGHRVYLNASRREYLEIVDETGIDGGRMVAFRDCQDEQELIQAVGHVPLPPYITRKDVESDHQNYQTVYAEKYGSVAAPTAGLHFTSELLENLQNKGIQVIKILLHVGLGTFRPVSADDIRDHSMHFEYYQISEEAAKQLNTVRLRGGRIAAVGTTVVRTLETVYSEQGYQAGEGETNLFIYPGYQFQAIDMLISNFHLPGSSLIMLVSAFAGYKNTMNAYQHAVASGYRFFSYGDAMLVL